MLQAPSSTVKMYLRSTTGSSFDITNGSVSQTIKANVKTHVRVEYDGSKYIIAVSADGTTWQESATADTAKLIRGGSPISFAPKASNTDYVKGTYDLRDIKLYVNQKLYWRAV